MRDRASWAYGVGSAAELRILVAAKDVKAFSPEEFADLIRAAGERKGVADALAEEVAAPGLCDAALFNPYFREDYAYARASGSPDPAKYVHFRSLEDAESELHYAMSGPGLAADHRSSLKKLMLAMAKRISASFPDVPSVARFAERARLES